MKLPHREKAYIPDAKIQDYLLSKIHSVGRSKARFFRAHGFDETKKDLLVQQLMNIVHSEEVKEIVTSPYGIKYILEGALETPLGNLVKVRTVWIIDENKDRPRFVTAYPL